MTEETHLLGTRDFRTNLLKIKAHKLQALFMAGYQEQHLIIQQAKELGLEVKLLAGPPYENKKLITDLGELAEGVIYLYYFLPKQQRPHTQRYLNAY